MILTPKKISLHVRSSLFRIANWTQWIIKEDIMNAWLSFNPLNDLEGIFFHGHDISAVTGIRKGKSGLGTRTKYLEKLRSAFLRHRRRADVEKLK